MSSAAYDFNYSVEDINDSVRRTGVLLRAANAVRLSVADLQDLSKKPTFTKLFWTVIQFSRTYTAIRRIYRQVIREVNVGTSLIGIMSRIVEPPIITPTKAEIIPSLDLSGLSVHVDAFRENLPIGLNGISLTNLPEDSRIMLQALIEDDAQITVENAQELLHGRILHPEESTGILESSIHWQPQVDGVRILADAYYAWWVETGHQTRGGGYFEGHHYLRDAVDIAQVRLPERIKNELNGLLFNETI